MEITIYISIYPTLSVVTPEGKWLFDSPSLCVRFENPKFDVTVPAKYDVKDNVIRCNVPQLLSQETAAQLRSLDAELKVTTEDSKIDDGEKKRILERIDKDKKNIKNNLPKNKVEMSVSLNGVDFTVPKGSASYTYLEPVTSLKASVDVMKPGDEIILTGEGIINAKGTFVKLSTATITKTVPGKYVKEKNGVSFKVPTMESIEGGVKSSDIIMRASISFNDMSDWSDADVAIRYTF
jgi:hypothetical protein